MRCIDLPTIKVEETNLEDLILLGEDKLVNITIEFPSEKGQIKAKAKIKQLTMKEFKGIDLNKQDLESSVEILEKALYTSDGEPFSKDLILKLPIGVLYAITEEILKLSGVNKDMGF